MTTDYTSGRRGFLKGLAIGGAASVGLANSAGAQSAASTPSKSDAPAAPRTPPPDQESSPRDDGLTYSSCGGDYMVDVIRGLGIEYFAATPGNTFMGLIEAVIDYGMLTTPNLGFITTLHEEASVAMAHGYAKVEGKPMACGMHTAVGLQHGSMAIYNAWCDRVPIFMICGASLDSTTRRDGSDWEHAAQDGAAMVRDFTKWDDAPGSLRGWGESAVRAYKFAMTPPHGPVLLATDTLMQEDPYPGGAAPPIPKLPDLSPPVGDQAALDELAAMLAAAESPVIVADRMARTPAGLAHLTELAEVLQAPVCDTTNRFNFPWRHPLNQSERQRAVIGEADLVLELEPSNPFQVTTFIARDGRTHPLMKDGSKRVTISSLDLFMKSNFQDMQRYPPDIDLAIEGDAEATLPYLVEAVKRAVPANARSKLADRGAKLGEAHLADLDRARTAAEYGWDDQPISTARLCAELYAQIHDEDWCLASYSDFQCRWPQRLWTADKHHRYLGGSGGWGIGYCGPATLGAALANKKHGRLTVALNGDGDTMFGPGVFWTAAHEQIPILYLIHNNRCYHMELMQMQAIANRRQRGVDRVRMACEIDNPGIDYAMLAKSMGVYSQGPIDNPADLGPAIRRALAVVKKGEPALVDVVAQAR
jgi:acetolactate synthase-1/2/3 large subunit